MPAAKATTAPAAKKTTKASKPAATPPAAAPEKTAAKALPKKDAVARDSAKKKDAAKAKPKKIKIVRDSFTMPEPEYKVLGEVKRTCLKAGIEVKKSELLRVGVALLQKLKIEDLRASLAELMPVKAGRPKAAK